MIHTLNDDSGATPPPRLRDRFRRTTRATILDAAEAVYAREGFAAGRMEQIAAAAGVSVGTLYNYFTDRRALVGSLLEERRAELVQRVDDVLSGASADPIERLRVILCSTLEHFAAHRAFVRLLTQESAEARETTRTSTILCKVRERLEEALERARDQGRLREPDAAFLSHLLAGSLRSAILHDLEADAPPEPAARAQRLLDLFLEGAGKPCQP